MCTFSLLSSAAGPFPQPPWGSTPAPCAPRRRCTCLIMTLACPKLWPLFRPRDPRASDLWRLLDEHFDSFRQVYDKRFQAKYGF